MNQHKFRPAIGILVTTSMLLTAPLAVADEREQALIERIRPVGTVCVEGDQDCAVEVAASSTSAARSGAEVYAASCLACHDAGLAGAPKPALAADWEARLPQGIEVLVSNAINGIRGMPPRGTCMNCSDEEIGLAVEHMVQGL